MAAGNTRRTKHCLFRLANVVMSKNMVTRLIEVTGKNFDRPDLDDVRASEKAQFWRSVEAAYRIDDEEYRGLVADDLDFDGIDPEANFRLSGVHEREFKKFTHGKADVLYLWYWTKVCFTFQFNKFISNVSC
ncbi:hypothetical protein PHMEG_00017771 [Phytophthora megakarya]|uniref:Uncharacterized protein n=1 Tax=Phytophthora megakarya TaxID=4795 RepID=A0A225VXK9_9STRA|nr:hypothetical protein PHMEG_00017771 [Phytophthora megakarya]